MVCHLCIFELQRLDDAILFLGGKICIVIREDRDELLGEDISFPCFLARINVPRIRDLEPFYDIRKRYFFF